MEMEQEQAKRIIEALLFTSDKPLSAAQMQEVLEELDVRALKSLIEQLKGDYTATGRSFNITEVAGGYRISTHPEYAPWISKLYRKSNAEKLSHPSLETLAIIAYRQPITRLEIEDIRGVSVEGVLKTLLERSLVRISGRKKIPGRPFVYSTSKQFLEFFGLHSLDDLPALGEFEDANVELQKLSQAGNNNEIEALGADEAVKYSGRKEGHGGEDKEAAQEDRPD
jgi:segregation and condensation protein B